MMYIKPHYVREIFTDEGTVVLFNPINAKIAEISSKITPEYKNYSLKGVYDIKNDLLINNFFVSEDMPLDESKIMQDAINAVVNSNYLHLIIMPTEKCNFRCVYCYETHAKGKMDISIARGIVEYVRKEIKNYKGLIVSWFGGEPLLALDIMEYISKELIGICRNNRKTYYADITTNGYFLTLDVMEKLYNIRVFTFQITLDGGSETHDKQRVLCNGGKTFEVITNNIINITNNYRKKFLKITLRTNLTNEIMDNSIEEYLEFVKENFANDNMIDLRFRIAWEGNDTVENKDIYIDSNTQAYQKIYSLLRNLNGLNFYGDFSELLVGGGVCYAAKKNDYAIGSDGLIYKCTVHFDDEKNKIGYVSRDGSFNIDENKLNYWIKTESISDKCLSCTSKISCLGIGCPYNCGERLSCNAVSTQEEMILCLVAKDERYSIQIHSL